MRKQVKEKAKLSSEAGYGEDLTALADSIASRLTAVEEQLMQTKNESRQDPLNFPIRLNNKIAALAGVVSRSNGRPTTQGYDVFDDLYGQIQAQLSEFTEIMETDVPAFNQLVRDQDIPAVWVEQDKADDN